MRVFFTPGPAQLYHTVPFHLNAAIKNNIGSISHRSSLFKDIFNQASENLKSILNLPEGYHIFFTSSATEIWERIIQNLVIERSHHFVNGAFAKKFLEIANNYSIRTTASMASDGGFFTDFTIPEETELISITLNETSTGFQFLEQDIIDIRLKHPEKLISLDVVSIAPAVKIDFSLVDTAYFSVQKCFGLPAGLGVWIVNEKAISKCFEKEKLGFNTGSYHSISQLLPQSKQNMTPETPNVLAIYLLAKVTGDLLSRGIKNIQTETLYKASLIYQLADNNSSIFSFISEKLYRSKSVIVLQTNELTNRLLAHFEKLGIEIGTGYGKYAESQIRIANFPAHSKEQFELLHDELEKFIGKI